MRYLAVIPVILALFTQGVFGNIYVDLNAAYTRADDLENQTGIGSTVSISVMNNLNFFLRGLYHTYQKDPNEPEETDYSYSMMMGGLQYTHRLGESQFFWISSLGVGNARAEIEPRYSIYPDAHESGLCAAVWTGFLLEATQRVGLYVEAGYHKASFSNDLEEASVGGLQVLFGIRVTIWGKNRGLFSDY